MFDACPANRTDLKRGNKTVVFEDGSGLTFANNGSFWIESKGDVQRAIDLVKRDLTTNAQLLQDVLGTAGALA